MEYSAVIWAGGFPDETSYLRTSRRGRIKFRAHPFWSRDPFAHFPWGVSGDNPDVRIAIFGGGDGALQDFLRVATGCRSAVEFYRKLSIPAGVEQRLYSTTDRAQRNWLWGAGTLQDHGIHRVLDNAYRAEAEMLLSDRGFRSAMQAAMPTRMPTSLRIFYRCEHLTAFYGLNRFLAYLVAIYLDKYQGALQNILNPRWTLVDVQSRTKTHHCNTADSTGCIGVMHNLKLAQDPFCYRAQKGSQMTVQANVIILRFGFDRLTVPRPPLPKTSVRVTTSEIVEMLQSRQHAPYHIFGPDHSGSWI
jgi:hypothetical protein